MKSFKNFLENYDVYLDMIKNIHGLSGGKPEADEPDDVANMKQEMEAGEE